ncbi:hypothetical protein [Delftia sp. GW456-R20]|uniref:hypothetical protein n=1 Tax=Delftia sp. GW456-R20 TaxID=1827145 RepID=UPI000AC7CE23|nr:hypothetical protein [Delftia sp. GW456-R20]
MWYSTVNRKEFVEIFSLSLSNRLKKSLKKEPSFSREFELGELLLVGWKENPSEHSSLPCLAVARDSDISNLLALVNSIPQAPSPFTAFCRIIGKKEFLQYGDSLSLDFSQIGLEPLLALSYAEALFLADGQIQLTSLSPAICKRTLSFTWAKAVASKIPITQFGKMVDAWIDVYKMTTDPSRIARLGIMVGAMLPVIHTLSELLLGENKDLSLETEFCRALMDNSKERQELSWKKLAAPFIEATTLASIAKTTREERSQIFQKAIKSGASPFVTALMATQISPGTLDHIEIMLSHKDPSAVFWYAALAALARPHSVLTTQTSLSLRLERLISQPSGLEDYPQGDLSYSELQVLSRLGLEQLSRYLEHAGEIKIELVPLIVGIFRFSGRSARPENNEQDRLTRERQIREQQRENLLSIARMIEELAYSQEIDSKSQVYKNQKSTIRRKTF